MSEYEQLHANANAHVFVIVPGYSRIDGEVVLYREDRFEQVEKHDS